MLLSLASLDGALPADPIEPAAEQHWIPLGPVGTPPGRLAAGSHGAGPVGGPGGLGPVAAQQSGVRWFGTSFSSDDE